MTVDPIAALGPEQDVDWKLEPLGHARQLPPAAGALLRVLERPDNAAVIERFITADREAVKMQMSYVGWSRRSPLFRFLSIVCGTVALLDIAGLLPAGVATPGLVLQYALIAASLVTGLMLSVREPFERWMRARAAAENARIDLFGKITSAIEPERPGESKLLPLQLEYFRRYMLDTQRRFYRKRGLEHARAAGESTQWRCTMMGLTVLAVFIAALGFLGTFTDIPLPQSVRALADALATETGLLVMLAGGTLASALGDLTAALSSAGLHRRNAARYLANADNLDILSAKYLAEARAAAAAGDRGQTQNFIDLVQGIISSEYREWLPQRAPEKDHIGIEGIASKHDPMPSHEPS